MVNPAFLLLVLLVFLIIILFILYSCSRKCIPCTSEMKSPASIPNINPTPQVPENTSRSSSSNTSSLTEPRNSENTINQLNETIASPLIEFRNPENTINQLTEPIAFPVYTSPIETISRHPIGTHSLYSLPKDIQGQLLINTPTVTVRSSTYPPFFDSRDGWPGLISEPMDQRECGSCWAFSTAVVFSDRLRIQFHHVELLRRFYYALIGPDKKIVTYTVLNNISPYQLIFCDLCSNKSISKEITPICNDGCSGGVIANAFDYLVKKGANSILSTLPHPPDPNDPNSFICDFTLSQPVYRGKYKYIITTPTEQESIQELKIKQDVYDNGPVSAAFTVYNSFYGFFDKNPDGIYTSAVQPKFDNFIGGHAISIVGWGEENNQKYWIVRNSWGINWGNEGFFKIQYNWRPPANVELDPSGNPPIGILDEVWAIRV